MRKLRIVVSMSRGVPALVAAAVVPVSACGARTGFHEADVEVVVADAAPVDVRDVRPPIDQRTEEVVSPNRCEPPSMLSTQLLDFPDPGTPAQLDQVCLAPSPVISAAAATLTFTDYDPVFQTARGTITVPNDILGAVVGLPTLHSPNSAMGQPIVSNLVKVPGGFELDVRWPNIEPRQELESSMLLEVDLPIRCPDGSLAIVTGRTYVARCHGDRAGEFVLAVGGNECTTCTVIAEMAPTPIVSDNRGDDLPLGRVIGLRVRELARFGNRVVLLAENDGGKDTFYEWRISGGEIEHLAADVVLWTVPASETQPFGQVAVWNDDGAAVENFVWKIAS
jgi:hypothetical protein